MTSADGAFVGRGSDIFEWGFFGIHKDSLDIVLS